MDYVIYSARGEIYDAIEKDDFDKIEELLDLYLNPLTRRANAGIDMFCASILKEVLAFSLDSSSNNKLFELVLKYINIDGRYFDDGKTLLMHTIQKGYPTREIILVLSYINDINIKDYSNESALAYLIYRIWHNENKNENFSQLYHIIEMMVDMGAKVINNYNTSYPIGLALKLENILILKILLKNTVTIPPSVFKHAIHSKFYDGVELLLSYVSDINEVDYDGTILQYAQKYGNSDIIDLLVESGARE